MSLQPPVAKNRGHKPYAIAKRGDLWWVWHFFMFEGHWCKQLVAAFATPAAAIKWICLDITREEANQRIIAACFVKKGVL